MKLTFKVDTKEFEKAMKAAPVEVCKELYVAVGTSLRNVAGEAKRVHKFHTKSGQLARSIIYEVRPDGLYGEARLEESIAAYGKYQHDGTRPHIIRASEKAALHFVKNGVPWFVPKRPTINGKKNRYWAKVQSEGGNVSWKGYVNHPGIQADPFLYNAFFRQRPAIEKRITKAIESAYRKAGV